jgi:hypothetical protein
VGSFTDHAGKAHGFVDHQGQFRTLDVPGATSTIAYGIKRQRPSRGRLWQRLWPARLRSDVVEPLVCVELKRPVPRVPLVGFLEGLPLGHHLVPMSETIVSYVIPLLATKYFGVAVGGWAVCGKTRFPHRVVRPILALAH